MPEKIKVLFICLGNICRSPLAEALFENHVRILGKEHLFEIDSCGTGGWHQGEPADKRMIKTAESHQISITHKARQILDTDFEYFDYLMVMDHQNLSDVKSINSDFGHKAVLITDFTEDFQSQIIPDPYFGDIHGFETVFRLLEEVTGQVANTIINQHRA